MTIFETEAAPRGAIFSRQEPGYHQCWYPVGLSADLATGQVIGLPFCDGRIVVYRGEDSVVRATSAYCPHMGADLGVGDVVGNTIRCGFHHWCFGEGGACTDIPSGDPIPKGAKVFAFPVEEKWGVIWVFYGPEPLYPVLSFPTWDDTMVSRAFEVELTEPMLVDPWVFSANAFDFSHLRELHNWKLDENPEISQTDVSIGWTTTFDHPQGGTFTQSLTMWGTNSITMLGEASNGELASYLIGGTPMGPKGNRYFMVAAARLESFDAEGEAKAEAMLDRLQLAHTTTINEDLPILNNLNLDQKSLLVGADRSIGRYVRYARQYPRTTMAELVAS